MVPFVSVQLNFVVGHAVRSVRIAVVGHTVT